MKIHEFQGGYRWLSNFAPCNIEYEGIAYPTVEHAYQASKTLDVAQRKYIAALATPGDTKRYARLITLRNDWEDIKVAVMRELLTIKFDPIKNPEYARLLVETGDAELIEGNNWHDNFWGHCYCRNCVNKFHYNWLGKLIARIRKEHQ